MFTRNFVDARHPSQRIQRYLKFELRRKLASFHHSIPPHDLFFCILACGLVFGDHYKRILLSHDNKMKFDLESNKNDYLESSIDTDGGTYVHGNVDIHSGNFIGRDAITAVFSSQVDMAAIGSNIRQYKSIYQYTPRRPIDDAILLAAQEKLAALPTNLVPSVAPLPVGSRMPYPFNPLFVGRDSELRQLAEILKGDETARVIQNVVVSGLGGIGKTQLATAFVHFYGQFFAGGIFWIRMDDSAAVPFEIVTCGAAMSDELRLDYQTLDVETKVSMVLAAWQTSLPRLLIFDNCEDPTLFKQWRPSTGGCRILVTSRRSEWSAELGLKILPLRSLPRSESVDLLNKFFPDQKMNDPLFDQIAEELGDLPLALHLAGSYLARYRYSVTSETYLTQLRSPTIFEHHSLQTEELSLTDHYQHVARTFMLSYERLDSTNSIDAQSLRLLARSACFAPGEPIHRVLLLVSAFLNSEGGAQSMQAEDALRRLLELGLLEQVQTDELRQHRLLMRFVQIVLKDGNAQSDVETVALYGGNYLIDKRSPSPWMSWQTHLCHITDKAMARTDERAVDLCLTCGEYLHLMGDINTARLYTERALVIQRALFGEHHFTTARCLHNLGMLIGEAGDYSAACSYLEQALIIIRDLNGKEHISTIPVLNNLGSFLRQKGEYSAARSYLEQSLAICQTTLGEQHSQTANSLEKLGILLISRNDLPAGRPYVERALAIRRTILGEQHLDTAMSLRNFGTLFIEGKDKDYALAQNYFEQALAIFRALFGEQHYHTAYTLFSLGVLQYNFGKYAPARIYLEQALTIQQTVLGEQHPDTAKTHHLLGMLFRASCNYVEAQAHLEQALKIRQRVFGERSEDTAETVEEIGEVFALLGNFSAANRYLSRAFAIRSIVSRSYHRKTKRLALFLTLLDHPLGRLLWRTLGVSKSLYCRLRQFSAS